jgi:SET domain-containing protein
MAELVTRASLDQSRTGAERSRGQLQPRRALPPPGRLPVYAIRQIEGKQRGVVATQPIPAHTEIVTCPVIIYDWTDAGRIEKTRLGHYNFRFGKGQHACIVLGIISLCNHDDSPNAEVVCHEAEEAMTLVAIRPIAAGEEICIKYRRTLWFTPAA